MFRKHPDALVVGAGPIGLMSALQLAERGHSVEIIDEEWRTGAHSYALALHPGSLELLDEMGLAAELIRQGSKVQTLAFYEGPDRKAEINLAQLPSDFPYVLVLAQDILEGLLERRLGEHRVKIAWNHRLANLQLLPEKAVATIDTLTKESSGYGFAKTEWVVERTRKHEPSFIVGADGHRSVVRRLLDIDYEGVADPYSFAVFEFQTAEEIPNEVRVVMDDSTTNVFWPLGPTHGRWSFQLAGGGTTRASARRKGRLVVEVGGVLYPHVSEESFRKFVAERAPWFGATITGIQWSMEVPFQPRLASSMGRGRCWLVGDAAHSTGPVGVQSMNVGVREARDLASRIGAVLKDGKPANTVEAYGRERTEEWQRLLGIKGGLSTTPDADPWVANKADRILSCLPASGESLAKLAAQIGLTFG